MSKGLVVITGASAGFGQATALAFAKLGYSLALGARRVEKLRAVAAYASFVIGIIDYVRIRRSFGPVSGRRFVACITGAFVFWS